MPELHCSACDAVIPSGAKHCPGCGLQLMSIAQPAVYAIVPRYPWWAVIGVALVAMFGFMAIMSSHDEARAADAKAAFISDLGSGKLSTSEAFQSRCGVARWTEGSALHYYAAGQDIFVTLSAAAAPKLEIEYLEMDRSKPHTYRTALDPIQAFRLLGCK